METGGPSALVLILGILAANAILILCIYGLVRWLRTLVLDNIRHIGEEIQEHAGRLGQTAGFLQEYVGINQEPYSAHLDELQGKASELQSELNEFVAACRNFEEEVRSPGANKLQELINAPFNWFRYWRRARILRAESQEIAGKLTAAEERIQHILELPWDQATQCRQLDQDVAELIQTAQELQTRGAQGAALRTILDQIPILQRAVNSIPSEFLEADHDQLLAAANLDATIRVYEVLNRACPAVNRYLPQVRDWQDSYQKAAADYGALKQAGTNLRQAMANPPEGLIVTPLKYRLDQVAQLAADVGVQLGQPDVENLKPLARETSQLRRVLQDIEQQLDRASQQTGLLGQLMNDLQEGLEKLSAQADELEHGDTFPLTWDESSSQLSEMRHRLQTMGPAQQPRTPEQVAQQLKEVERMRARHQAQAAALPKVAEQHQALLVLLAGPEIREGAAWLRKAQETLRQASAYDPRNWPKQDGIQTLPAELNELHRMHESLVPVDHATPVQESTLAQRLKDTQQLATLHKDLRPRVENVRQRLEKIQALEKEGKEKLTEAYTALERVGILTESNPVLDEIASSEIERLSEEIRQLGNELNAQQQGEIEKKLQKINALVDKGNRALNGWLARLNSAITEQGRQTNSRLVQLDAVAQVDDPAVADARSLLLHEDYLSAQQGVQLPGGKTGPLREVAARVTRQPNYASLDALEIMAQIKRKNDLWQKLTAAHQALVEKTEALVTAYQETVQARGEAQEALAEIAKRLPVQRSWPPSNQTPLTDAQVLQPIHDKWEALKKQPKHIDAAILEIGRLGQQYQLASERVRQLLERVRQDEERVQELEEQVKELKQRWQVQTEPEASNPVVREGVHVLMSEADSKLSYIKQQYMRGTLTYEQVIHSLTLLYDELLAARVQVDDSNDIGLNGTNQRLHQTNR